MEKKRFLTLFSIIPLLFILVALPRVSAFAQPAPLPKPLPESISISAFLVGSKAYNRSVAISAIVNKYTPIKAVVQPMPGATCLALLSKGEIDLGGVSTVDTKNAYIGKGEWEKMGPNTRIRQFSIAGISPADIFARADRGIKTIPDLKGKKVFADYVGSRSAIGEPFRAFLDYYGIEKDVKILAFSDPKEAISGVIEGRGDAFVASVAGHLHEARRGFDLVYVPIPKEAVERANKRVGGGLLAINAGAIDAKLYGMPEGLPIYGWAFCLSVRRDLSAEAVYTVIKAIYDHYDELSKINPEGKEMKLDAATIITVTPYHEGAIRYYKEKGMWTSELEATQRKLLEEEAKWSK